MVVTSSRLHAVRYKQALDRYIREQGLRRRPGPWSRSRARSSTRAIELTEPGMNGFPESRDGEAVRRRRLPSADRRREVPDRLRPAAAAHDVRRQAAHRPARRADPVPAQPHPPAREDRHVRARLPQQRRGDPGGVPAVLRTHRRGRRPTRTCSTTRAPTSTRSTCSAPTRSNRPPGCSLSLGSERDHPKLYALLDPAVERFSSPDDSRTRRVPGRRCGGSSTSTPSSRRSSRSPTPSSNATTSTPVRSPPSSPASSAARLDLGQEVELSHLRLDADLRGLSIA